VFSAIWAQVQLQAGREATSVGNLREGRLNNSLTLRSSTAEFAETAEICMILLCDLSVLGGETEGLRKVSNSLEAGSVAASTPAHLTEGTGIVMG
jgi:hypothetical protein